MHRKSLFQSFVLNWWFLYWLIVLFAVPFIIGQLNPQGIPARSACILVACSLATTGLWCWFRLIQPVKRSDFTARGIGKFCGWAFKVNSLLIVFGLVGLLVLYSLSIFDFFGGQLTIDVISGASSSGYAAFDFIIHYHVLIFILLFSTADVWVALGAESDRERTRYSSVVVFVDVPLILATMFIIFGLRSAFGEQFYVFEAGAVAFQLIFGSFAVLAFDVDMEADIDEVGYGL